MSLDIKYSICGVVVCFYPDTSVVSNIKSYIHQVDFLIIVDNSEIENRELLSEFIKLESVKYIWNKSNQGLAYALNQAGNYALKNNYDFLFTVDQDSDATKELVEQLFVHFSPSLGVIAPHHQNKKFPKNSDLKLVSEVPMAMTSGNLVNLKAYQQIGGFDEKLFIDFIDYDFCFRMNLNGYKVLSIPEAILYHNLGNISKHMLFGRYFHPTNHSAKRLYYRIRNSAYVFRMYKSLYPEVIWHEKKKILKIVFKIIFFEKEKLKKMYMICLGIVHFLRSRYGKYE